MAAIDLIKLIKESENEVKAKTSIEDAFKGAKEEDKKASLLSQDENGNTALHWAVENNYPEIVNLILDEAIASGIFENMLSLKDKTGNTALNAAILGGVEAIALEILNKLFANPVVLKTVLEIGNDSETNPVKALITAEGNLFQQALIQAKNFSQSVVDELLEAKDQDGKRALHIAVAEEKEDVIEVIFNAISGSPKEIDHVIAADKQSNTALHWAVELEQESIIKKFMMQYSSKEVMLVKDSSGNTALNAAILGGKSEGVVKTIVQGSSWEVLKKELVAENTGESAPLKVIIAANKKELLNSIVAKAQAEGTLSDFLTFKDENGKTAIDIAIEEDATEVEDDLWQLDNTAFGKLFRSEKVVNLINEKVYTKAQLISCKPDLKKLEQLTKQETVEAIKAGTYTAEELVLKSIDWALIGKLVTTSVLDKVKVIGKLTFYTTDAKYFDLLKYNVNNGSADTQSLLQVAKDNNNEKAVHYLAQNQKQAELYKAEFTSKFNTLASDEDKQKELSQYKKDVSGCEVSFDYSNDHYCLVEPEVVTSNS